MKNILELNNQEAREFFLDGANYSNCKLPRFFKFDHILKDINGLIENLKKDEIKKIIQSAKKEENISYKILINKDGKLNWREIQLINPVIYVILVKYITSDKNWTELKDKLNRFHEKSKDFITCESIPRVPPEKAKNPNKYTRAQVESWLNNVEQRSIIMSLEYKHVLNLDIENCYGSIYTHSIDWALSGKEKAKENKNSEEERLGEKIDEYLRALSYGETIGIPQGSALMDFIAEILLGYIDEEILKKINSKINKDEFRIIRYRDDYRIFVNDIAKGKEIVKSIYEVLLANRMKPNSQKTNDSNDIVKNSIKSEKLFNIIKADSKDIYLNKAFITKHLLKAKYLVEQFPTKKAALKGLLLLYRHLFEKGNEYNLSIQYVDEKEDVELLISIIIDIICRCPMLSDIGIAIIGQFMSLNSYHSKGNKKNYSSRILAEEEIIEITRKIIKKTKNIPNCELLYLQFQRIILFLKNKQIVNDESIKKLIEDWEYKESKLFAIAFNLNSECLWNSDWLLEDEKKDPDNIIEQLKEVLEKSVIDEEYIKNDLVKAYPPEEEINLFDDYCYYE